MSISGNLKTMELSELLQWVSMSQKTGTLVFHSQKVEKKVVFEGGQITSTASTDPNEYLGHFLIGHGFISELELSQAIEMQDSNRMLIGKILVTIGAIEADDLARILRLKAEESLYDIFNWPEGEFRFLDDELPESTMMPMALDVTAVIMEGTQRIDEWQRIREAIRSNLAIPVSMTDLLADDSLSAGDRNVLAQVNDDDTIAEICLQSHSSEYNVCRALYRQLTQGRLKVIHVRRVRLDTEVIDPGAVLAATAVEASTVVRQAQEHFESRDFKRSLRFLAAARSLEPENPQVQKVVEQAEGLIRTEIEKDGVVGSAIPTLNIAPEELPNLDLSPQEGYIVSRIDGHYDIQSILKISPMKPLEAQLVFWRLKTEGHIRLGES